MTLVFLGKVDTDHIPCIRKVAASITVQPFTLELSEVHHWKRPRVLWCGPDHIPLQLSKLVNDLQQGLIACGFEPEERDYKPHVTLMRKVKDVQRMQPLDRPVKWKPREFVLAGSHFGAKPPRYSIMNRWSI